MLPFTAAFRPVGKMFKGADIGEGVAAQASKSVDDVVEGTSVELAKTNH
ncbi:hypothetical protein E6C60_0952 [Paenibacillus algicola]|uniref:Uncharacterized protein n=1 Tax=Paenibacillus algicola TaxID=2565926 RepID=A0A4P8XJV6_9BACL|nr:hypothetical protein E6C60_0952 [Paenibacillus algicola]